MLTSQKHMFILPTYFQYIIYRNNDVMRKLPNNLWIILFVVNERSKAGGAGAGIGVWLGLGRVGSVV